MAEAPKQRDLAAFLDIPEDARKTTPSTNAIKPILRLSPQHNGSTLFDSFEQRAITNQLNRAIQSLNSKSPTFMSYLRSPFFGIYKENKKKTQTRIMFSEWNHKSSAGRASKMGTMGHTEELVSRLWKKVKQGLLWNK